MKNTKSNFDFLKNIDKELFEIILDAQKLFQDEYFNQCVVQLRIFGEKTAKRVLGESSSDMTFDDTINCLKDKIKNEAEQEFVDDLFFIKKEGNKCAHGEDIEASIALETFERAFEVAINYANAKSGENKFNSLVFDKTLLITGKEQKEMKLIDKYLKAAKSAQKELDGEVQAISDKEKLLNSKQGEFNSKAKAKDENGFKNKNKIVDISNYTKKRGRKKKQLTKEEQETKTRVKAKIKDAKKNLKENINKVDKPKKIIKKKQENEKSDGNLIRTILFVLFLIACISLLSKMIFIF